ncbi:hypothetical protein D3C78_1987660 [compost metagenome]
MELLLGEFGTEMNILHSVSYDKLVSVIGDDLASKICAAREGSLRLETGGGGIYGKVAKS